MSKKKIISLMIVFLFLASCSSVNNWRFSYFEKMDDSEIKAFMEGVRPDRSSVPGYYKYACFLKDRNRYRAAIQEFEKVLALDAGHVQSLNWIGICHDRLGNHETAITFYKRALQINPELDYAYNNLGYSLLLNGDFESAVKAFTKAIALDDANPQYHNNLGLAYFKMGRYSKSRDHVETGGGSENFHATLARLDKNENRKKNRIKQIDPPAALHRLAKHTEKEPENDLKKTAEIQAEPADTEKIAKNKAYAAADPANNARGPAKIEISNGNGVPRMASKVGAYLKTKDL
ncbi:MAG: tetratricopeptide repeat protein, partial [Desulfobacteraceae bacterium]|nr:tetratricopeptide repeat protein [Desulfobacteraceae bacterium]